MRTVCELLRSVTNFPISANTLEALALKRGLDLNDSADAEIVKSRAYLLTEADIYRWLYLVANMSQGGQSYNFTAEDKEHFRLEANKTYRLFGEDDMILKETSAKYGYKGSRL